MSHTYAVLEISPAAYREIKRKLLEEGYGHTIIKEGDGEVIDMHGIAVKDEETPVL